MLVTRCDASISKSQGNGTVYARPTKEQRPIEITNRKNIQDKTAEKIGDGGRSCARLFQENKLASKAMNLTYIPPVILDGEVIV